MLNKIRHSLEMIKFSHTVFALPFALTAMLYANQGLPSWILICKIIFAVLFARTAAMSFNRLVDAKMDALNPRTQNRHIPAGILSRNYVLGLTLLSSMAFIFTAYLINPLCFYLSPLALLVVFFYSLSKRFTHLTQIFLGLSLGIAPLASWIAVTGHLNHLPYTLAGAVLFWVAGFDLLYACQDYEFDKANNVKSLVAKLGPKKALNLSKIFHILFLFLLLSFAYQMEMGTLGLVGTFICGSIIVLEHWIFDLSDPNKIQASFFTANGVISMAYLIFVGSDILVRI